MSVNDSDLVKQICEEAKAYTDKTASDIKKDLEEIYKKSPNLIDFAKITKNKIFNASGVEVDSSNSHTDYIPVKAGDVIWYKACDNSNTGTYGVSAIAFFKPDKTTNGTRFTFADGVVHSTTIPSGVGYVAFNIPATSTVFSANIGSKYEEDTSYGASINRDVLKYPKCEYIIVDKSGKGDCTKVSDAVKNAHNGATIFVMPGVYSDEIIEAWGKEIHIVGTSPETCIIKNATGTYSTPPIEIGTGSLENISVIAEAGTSTDANGWRDYAVHIDDNNLYGKSLDIINCKLISYNNHAIGMGLRGNSTVTLKECQIYGKSSKGGGLFFHDSAYAQYTGEQNIDVINCDIRSEATTEPTLKITSQCMSGATVNVRFIGCNVYNKNGSSYEISSNNVDGSESSGSITGNSPWRGLKNFFLTPDSYGNRKSNMNYDYLLQLYDEIMGVSTLLGSGVIEDDK